MRTSSYLPLVAIAVVAAACSHDATTVPNSVTESDANGNAIAPSSIVVAGTVTDAAGHPLSRVFVHILPMWDDPNPARMVVADDCRGALATDPVSVYSDAAGNFSTTVVTTRATRSSGCIFLDAVQSYIVGQPTGPDLGFVRATQLGVRYRAVGERPDTARFRITLGK